MFDQQQKPYFYWMTLVALIAVFVFLRLYQLPTTLNFFGDIGRDFVKLQSWQQTGKPPLLGPMTSVISFNQSAIYFYYLFPFFLILNGSPLATTVATIFLYVFSLIIGLYCFRKKPVWQKKLLIIFWLITINPIFIEHHRYVWNPSLLTPFLIASFFLLLKLKNNYSNLLALFFSLSVATAVSLNYSVVPAVLVLCLLGLIYLNWPQRIKLIIFSLASGLLVNLPTLVFELRHNFFLTKKLPSQELLQKSVDFKTKLINFTGNLFSLPIKIKYQPEILIMIGLSLLVLLLLLISFKKTQKNSQYKLALSLFLVTSILTLLTPFRMHAHYLYGVLSLFFITLAFLPRKMWLVLVASVTIAWLNPTQLKNTFKPATFTIREKQACLAKICQAVEQPFYLNLNADSHNHQALGYIYLARKQDCAVVSAVEFPTQPTKYMVVINQATDFNLDKTDYYELGLFGQKEFIKSQECSSNLSYTVFKQL